MRLTGLTAGNAVGEKLPLFVIGQSKKPRCFKHIKHLPCRYIFYKQSIFDTRPQNCLAFLKNRPKKLFSNCLVDGLLTSIVSIFKHSERRHSLLQGHLQYVMHTFELTSQKVSISLRFPMHKKVFSLYSE